MVNNRTSSGSEGNSSDSGFHQMSSGQSNYSDDSLPPPPAGLKLSPSPEPPNGNLQIDCDYDAQQDFAHEGFADVDSAFSDSMSLPSSGSHISVTTTSSGSSMGSGGITNSPTPVGISISFSCGLYLWSGITGQNELFTLRFKKLFIPYHRRTRTTFWICLVLSQNSGLLLLTIVKIALLEFRVHCMTIYYCAYN